MNNACENCRFWFKTILNHQCRVRPPKLADPHWPATNFNDWCGKYEKITEEPFRRLEENEPLKPGDQTVVEVHEGGGLTWAPVKQHQIDRGQLKGGFYRRPNLLTQKEAKQLAHETIQRMKPAESAMLGFEPEEPQPETEIEPITAQIDFMECEACSKKPGMPTLCQGCLHNRHAINQLKNR